MQQGQHGVFRLNATTMFRAELISIQWTTPNSGLRQNEGLLEAMTGAIALIWTDGPIPKGRRLAVRHLGGDFNGCVLESNPEADGFVTKLVVYEKSGRTGRRQAMTANPAFC
jgi:hypothetical protein